MAASDTPTLFSPEDTIYINPSRSGSSQTFHVDPDCRYVRENAREKQFRHRPLTSSVCKHCGSGVLSGD